MDPAVEVWILEARRRNPDWGPRRLVHEASRAGVEPPPSRSGVYRALKRAQLIDPEARRRRDRRFRRWERGGPMELWQLDVVGGVLLTDGRECKVLTGIDDHSRFVVSAGVMLRATSRAVCRHFAEALGRHGVPQEVLTDNGKVFTGRFGLTDTEVLFDRICRENGIDHLLSCGKHRAGRRVDIHLQGPTMQIWDGEELVKTVLRTNGKEVRKRRAARAS